MQYIIPSEIQLWYITQIFNENLFVTRFSKPKDRLSKKTIDYTSASSQKSETWFIPNCQSFNIINKSHGISDLGWCLSSLDQLPVQRNSYTSPEKKTAYYHIQLIKLTTVKKSYWSDIPTWVGKLPCQAKIQHITLPTGARKTSHCEVRLGRKTYTDRYR